MDWIKTYEPQNAQEAEDREHLLRLNGKLIGTDRADPYHYTTSSMVFDREKGALLMIYHPIYKSWSWPGGHVEPKEDLLYAALRELYEETGIQYVKPAKKAPIGMQLLAVKPHKRKGVPVDAHFHINFTFGFFGKTEDTLLAEEKNRLWVPEGALETFVTEDHMLPIYREMLERLKRYGAA